MTRSGAARLGEDIEGIYDALTDGRPRSLRVAELVYAAAERFPGLVPTRAEIDGERERLQKDKVGLEIAQGDFVAHVLADPRTGAHLMHAMAQPRPEALGLRRTSCRAPAAPTSARCGSTATAPSAWSRSRTTPS